MTPWSSFYSRLVPYRSELHALWRRRTKWRGSGVGMGGTEPFSVPDLIYHDSNRPSFSKSTMIIHRSNWNIQSWCVCGGFVCLFVCFVFQLKWREGGLREIFLVYKHASHTYLRLRKMFLGSKRAFQQRSRQSFALCQYDFCYSGTVWPAFPPSKTVYVQTLSKHTEGWFYQKPFHLLQVDQISFISPFLTVLFVSLLLDKDAVTENAHMSCIV